MPAPARKPNRPILSAPQSNNIRTTRARNPYRIFCQSGKESSLSVIYYKNKYNNSNFFFKFLAHLKQIN